MFQETQCSVRTLAVAAFVWCGAAELAATTLTGTFTPIAADSNVDLTIMGKLDWVQWGLGSDYRVNRKASVAPLISNFTIISQNVTNNPLSFSSAYWLDNTNLSSCSWSDGHPVTSTNTYTRVLAYAYPVLGGSGFRLTVPADTTTNVLKVFVGTISARGEFKATMNGQVYSESPLEPDVNGVYTITYAANAPGQMLSITWTLPFAVSNGYVTLQAAALTAPGADNPPFATLTSPANDGTFAAPANIVLSASAQDFDGTVTNVAFYAGTNKLGQSAISPYSFTWSNAPIGHHLLTVVASDNAGVSRSSLPREIFVYGTSGSQTGAIALPPTTVDLTAEGTAEWVHWGLTSSTSIDRKNGVAAQISNFTPLGTTAVQSYADNYTAFSWSDGTPTPAAGDTTTGVFITGISNGFYVTVSADTIPRKLRIYAGAYAARGHFLAYLSDFSAKPYIDTSIYDIDYDNEYAVYSVDYRAASPGQKLIVVYRSFDLLDEIYGNVTLQAATLEGGPSQPLPVSIIHPVRIGSDFVFSFATQFNHNYVVEYAGSLPPSWTTWTNVPGSGGIVSVTNRNVGSGQRFYRVQTQ